MKTCLDIEGRDVRPTRRVGLAWGLAAWMAFALPGGAGAASKESACLQKKTCTYESMELPAISVKPKLGYFTNGVKQPRAIIVAVHGYPRDAAPTLDAAMTATQMAGTAGATLVVAPLYKVTDPASCPSTEDKAPLADEPQFSCDAWKDGGLATVKGQSLSSFDVMDGLLSALSKTYPTAGSITLAGYSAGGQFVQRYAGYSSLAAGLRVRFVIGAPGSWLYFDKGRPAFGTDAKGQLTVQFDGSPDPGLAKDCPRYNEYPFGLDALPPHLARMANESRARYAQASFTYVWGGADVGDVPNAAWKVLEKSCQAEAQGLSHRGRAGRAKGYAAYHAAMFGAGRYAQFEVDGCAHDVACVFTRQPGIRALVGN